VYALSEDYKYKGKVKEKEKRIENKFQILWARRFFPQDGKINNSVSNPPVNVTFFAGGGGFPPNLSIFGQLIRW
jgi:hypothetical protein